MRRGKALLNLRLICEPEFVGDVREREELLAAGITVNSAAEIRALFAEYQAAGVDFFRTLKQEPWGAPEPPSCATPTATCCRLAGQRGDHGDLSLDQIGRHFRQPLGLPIRPAIVDQHGLLVDKSGIAQPLEEALQPAGVLRRGSGMQEADRRHRLLRTREGRSKDDRATDASGKSPALHDVPDMTGSDATILLGLRIGKLKP